MPNRLVGSLVVAQAESPAQTRTAKFAALAQELKDSPSSATAYLKRKLGSFVQPLDGPGFIAKSVMRVAGTLVVAGRTLAGQDIRLTVTDPARTFLPTWVTKVAALIRTAFEVGFFDKEIKALIAEKGLPVDPDVNWDLRLHSMFKELGIAKKDDDLRNQAIHDAIVTFFVYRKGFDRFNPDVLKHGEDSKVYAGLPLDKIVTVYLTKHFRWIAMEDGGVGDRMSVWHEGDAPINEESMSGAYPSSDAPMGRKDSITDAADRAKTHRQHRPGVDPEDILCMENEQGMDLFCEGFKTYIERSQSDTKANQIMTLLHMIIADATPEEILVSWKDQTGTGKTILSRTRKSLQELLVKFVHTVKAPPASLTTMIREIGNRVHGLEGGIHPDVVSKEDDVEDEEDTAGDKAQAMKDQKSTTAAQRFASALAQAVLDNRSKTAAPKVLDRSILYLKLQGDPADPRYLRLTFFGPKIRTLRNAVYRIEVGDSSTDPGLNQTQIRRQLSDLVIPTLKNDVHADDQDVLNKVILRLRKWAWEQAVDYFEVPKTEKRYWSNILKLDITRFEDTQVSLVDQNGPASQSLVAAVINAPHLIVAAVSRTKRVVSRLDLEKHLAKLGQSLASQETLTPDEQDRFAPMPDRNAGTTLASCEECDQDADAAWTPVHPRPTWNEQDQKWEPADKTPGGLLGGQPAKYAKAPGHAYKDGEGKWVCRACAKGQREKFGQPYNPDAPEIQGKTCSRCYKTLGSPEAKLKSAATWDDDFVGADDRRFQRRQQETTQRPAPVAPAQQIQAPAAPAPGQDPKTQAQIVKRDLTTELGSLLDTMTVQPQGKTKMTLRQYLGNNPVATLFRDTDRSVYLAGIQLRKDLDAYLTNYFDKDQIGAFASVFSNITNWLSGGSARGASVKTAGGVTESVAKGLGADAFNPNYHDGEAEPSPQHMAQVLENNGLVPNTENMRAALEGFKEVRDGHTVISMLLGK